MCSRFENKETGISVFQKLKKDLDGKFILESDEETKSINIAPTNKVLSIIRNKEKDYSIKNIFWGIQFNKDNKSPIIFNSRIETIKEKKFWNNIFQKNRCVLPATAFYEWKKIKDIKIPYRISLKNQNMFYIASIFLEQEGIKYSSMITTTPNDFVEKIHNRMPVILNQQQAFKFIEENNPIDLCKSLENINEMGSDIAEDILTDKQKEFLAKNQI